MFKVSSNNGLKAPECKASPGIGVTTEEILQVKENL